MRRQGRGSISRTSVANSKPGAPSRLQPQVAQRPARRFARRGQTMLARRMTTTLPLLTRDEALESPAAPTPDVMRAGSRRSVRTQEGRSEFAAGTSRVRSGTE